MAPKKTRLTQVLPRTHTFFKTLPRELRDDIYDRLLQEIGYYDQNAIIQLCAPLMTLRLISRQFKAEYEDRFLENEHLGKLEITHGLPFSNVFLPPLVACPHVATYTTSMTLNLYACHLYRPSDAHAPAPCDLPANLLVNRNWIKVFVTCLPHLRTIRVILLVFTEDCGQNAILSPGPIVDIPHVVEVKLRPGYRVAVQDMDDDLPTLATWTRQHGVVEDDEARDQCRQMSLFWTQ